MTVQIAVYGKGGVGKTTIAANISAALAESGKKVLLVGCSQTSDSSHLLIGDDIPLSICEYMQSAIKPAPSELITLGYQGIGCIEAGEFSGDDVCVSRTVAAALKLLAGLKVVEKFAPDFVIYDMPGDIGCIGTAVLENFPIGVSLVVTAGDFQSMYAANRVIGALALLHSGSTVALVANGSVSSFEDSFVADFASQIGLPVAAAIPRSLTVRHSELYGKTVIEAGPLSTHAYTYRRLARFVTEQSRAIEGERKIIPLSGARLKEWAREWGTKLGELEFGIIQDGAGI